MPFTSLNGRRVSYGDSGSGLPVVLIHGSFSTSSAWKRIVANFDVNRMRAITPDLPGWGDSDPAPEDCSDLREYQAAAVEAAVRQVAVDPIHLVAHSYGAVVALTIAIARRVAIRSLTLFEPLPLGLLAQTGDREAFDEVEAFVRLYRGAFDSGDEWAARHVIDFWGGSGTFDAMSPSAREAIAAGTAQNIRDWGANVGFRPSLDACRSIRTPLTVVLGDQASPIARLVGRRLCELSPDSALVEIPAAGHFMIHTHASESAKLVCQNALGGES
jgi:pimeloyl-ACP methyl ester carboxylesterase